MTRDDIITQQPAQPNAQVGKAIPDNHPLMVFAIECDMGAYQEHEIPLAAKNAIRCAKIFDFTPDSPAQAQGRHPINWRDEGERVCAVSCMCVEEGDHFSYEFDSKAGIVMNHSALELNIEQPKAFMDIEQAKEWAERNEAALIASYAKANKEGA